MKIKKTAIYIVVFSTAVMLICLASKFSPYGFIEPDQTTKTLIALSIFGIFFIFCALITLPLIAGGTLLGSMNSDSKKPLFFQVPINQKWVLRNVWNSCPKFDEEKKCYPGYEEKPEGWRVWLPTLWHSDEGLVDLTPVQVDLEPVLVNCTDGNNIMVDIRYSYYVRKGTNSAISYAINTQGKNVGELVRQRTKAALNNAMDVDSRKASEWGADGKKSYNDRVSEIVNDALRADGKGIKIGNGNEHAGIDYGLGCQIGIENIRLPETVEIAIERRKAAEIDLDAATNEAAAMKKKITETGANPTWVMVAESLSDAIRDVMGSKRAKRKTTEKKGD